MRDLTTSEIIGGLFIGGVLLWILTRKRETQPINDLQQTQIGIHNWKSLDYVQDFDEFNLRLTQSVKPVVSVESKSSKIVEQKVVEQIPDNSTAYKNEEKWKIIRDNNGDIAEISVSRDARVT